MAEHYIAIVESCDDAIISMNLDGVVTSWNRGAQALFGFRPDEVIGQPIAVLIPADRRDEGAAILNRIRRGERVDHHETVRRRKDGSLVDISLTVSPIRDSSGRITGVSKISRDITERRRAQEQQSLLLREMDHRIKNLFSIAGGLVALSARSAATPEDLALAVRSRLAALARAHALTVPKTDLKDTPGQTTLRALIDTVMWPYDGVATTGAARTSVAGSDLSISSTTVTSFALVLSELAANAAKYGALAHPAGRVEIVCSEESDRFVLIWRERDGPPVSHPGDQEGFGGLLLRATVVQQMGGEIRRDWKAEGLSIRLSIPRARLSAGGGTPQRSGI